MRIIQQFVGWRAYHVEVEECHTEAEIVLIEHPHELIVQKLSTRIEATSTPWIEGTALKLNRLSIKVEDILSG